MRIVLAYGKTEQAIELPASRLQLLEPKTPTGPFPTTEKLFAKAIASPLGSGTLPDTVRNRETVTIVVPDKTRNCGAHLLLPRLLQVLNRAGISDDAVSIILALGSHSRHQPGEVERIVGREICARVEVIEHDCKDSDQLVRLGKTKFGTRVEINRHLVEAPCRIAVATAVHHYFAGFGGGPKMINPGCAGYRTITMNHALSIDTSSGGIHPKCQAGVVKGNPIQEDLRDSLRFLAADFLIETVLNEKGEIVEIIAGDLLKAHAQACEKVDTFYKIPIREKADLVVVSCGGYPKDINLIQAHKALCNAFNAVKEGGVILALAECREGIGSQTFLEWFDYSDDDLFFHDLTQNYTLNATTALSLMTKVKSTRIILVSTLPEGLVEKLGMVPARSLQDGWRLASTMLPGNFDGYVITNGSLTLPFVEDHVH